MNTLKTVPAFIASTLLIGCGGSSNQTFPVSLDPEIEVVTTEDMLTIVADGTEISVPLSTSPISTSFLSGQTTGEERATVARFQSEVATASIGTTIGNDTSTILTSFERLEALDTLPTGQATATGTGVSVFTNVIDDDPATFFDESASFLAPISETVVLNIDFENSTIDGQITSDVVVLSGFVFIISEDANSIDLLETPIERDGSFDGLARYTNGPIRDDGTYGGLIAGEGGNTVVGSFEVPGRTGVFQATTE